MKKKTSEANTAYWTGAPNKNIVGVLEVFYGRHNYR